jgi:hypothetical protein
MKKDTHNIITDNIGITLTALALTSLIVGYFLGGMMSQERYESFLKSFRILRNPTERSQLINPLIGSSSNPATDIGFFVDEKREIVKFLEKEKRNNALEDYAFYVRDLNSGFWFGENESASFFPASLFKLPLAIAVYAQAEDNPAFLKKQVVYSKEFSSGDVETPTSLIVGKVYTVEQLVEIMLVQSDNAAKNTILSLLDVKYLQEIFNIAHLTDPTKTATYTVSTREYSLFLRVLYGSSFLNEEHSELLLKMLASSSFTEGLVSGVPDGVTVAHKYGIFQQIENRKGVDVRYQFLHDCGIVYHTQRPYVVCVMTKGKDEKVLSGVIAKVSSILYGYTERGAVD